MKEVGAARSIVIDDQGVVLAGNATLQAAKKAGIEKLQIVDVDGDTVVAVRRSNLTKRQKTRLALADNRAAELAEWDGVQLGELRAEDPDILKGLFTEGEQKRLIKFDDTRVVPAVDDLPAKRTTAIKEGDRFKLGRHLIICGDSTRIEVVEKVLQGRKVDCVFTDPPYGVNVTGAGGDAIAGDISFTAIPLMFDVLSGILNKGAWVYVCGGMSNMPLYGRLFERYFRQLPRVIVWDKGTVAVMRRHGYHSCFEFVYYTFLEGGGHHWYSPRTGEHADDIWRETVEHGAERQHTTQKPVSIPRRAIENTCPPKGLVFEPFSGSGSTLLACEQSDRTCAAVEIDPQYVQVAIDRWEALTGLKAEKG